MFNIQPFFERIFRSMKLLYFLCVHILIIF